MWRRPLLIIALVTAALLCQGCAEVSGARLRAPALDDSDRRWFARSCESVWPEAVRTLTAEGFRLVARDTAGRIASFMWADERRLGRLRATGDLEQFILAEDAGLTNFRNARIESAVLEAGPKNRGCQVRLHISYTLPRTSFGMKRGWISLASSGLFEQRLLERIAQGERAADCARKPADRVRPVEARSGALARVLVTGPNGDSAAGASEAPETRVVRLDGAN